MAVPFMNQMEVTPVTSLRHTRSERPSPLKSPSASTFQFRSEIPSIDPDPLMALGPLMIHIRFSPVPLLRQTMSLYVSPLKSPTAATCHADEICRFVGTDAVR